MKKQRLIGFYSQESREYPEDTWKRTGIIENEHDLFAFMKDCHLSDASNRNNYPLTSHWGRWVEFYIEDYEECNLGHIHVGERIKTERPDFYLKGWKLYTYWERRINRTIPALRKAKKEKEKSEKELREFKRLSEKFKS